MNFESMKEDWLLPAFLIIVGIGMTGIIFHFYTLVAFGFLGMLILYVLSFMENVN